MQIRFGILGPGAIAHRFMRDFHVAKDAQMIAVASRDGKRAQDFARQWSIPEALDSYEALCTHPQVDVVYVATPHPFHMQWAIRAMQGGKHVLVEKPVTVNAGQFEEMTRVAREQGVFLMEAMWTRFFPITLRAHELLKDGEIGTLYALQANFTSSVPEKPDSRLFAPEMAGGALLDVGCYPIAYAIDMFGGKPHQVCGYMHPAETGVDALDAMVMRFSKGVASLLCGTRASSQPDATLMGSEGSIYIPDFYHPRRLHLRRNGEAERVISCPYEEEGFAFEVQHVCECVRRGMQQSDRMPWADSLAAMQVMDELRADWGLRYPGE